MRYSQLFGKTKLTAPHDADSLNAKFLTQGGFVEKLVAGVYNFLPLGIRVLQKIQQIIREEMNAVDGQEILMPSLHPIELWEATGRNRTMNEILYRTKGANDQDFVFGPSHEEAVTPLGKKFIQSYKDLPFSVYQIQTKFRNEARAKSGVLRGREFGMKDMYSFHTSEKDLDEYYERVKQAYLNVYERCELTCYVVEASGGAFTKNPSHEFSVVTTAGEDTIIVCKKCRTAQNLEIAAGKVQAPDVPEEQELPMEEIEAVRGASIKESTRTQNIPAWKVLKTVVYALDKGGFLGVVIRGDLNVNQLKLEKYLGQSVRPATPEELEKCGLVQGFISPVGLQTVKGGLHHAAEIKVEQGLNSSPEADSPFHGNDSELSFIGDHSICTVKNFSTGANKMHTDFKNVNLGRDFTVSDFVDLVMVGKGFVCPACGSELHEEKAVEAGNIFKLGTKYSKDFELYFTDKDGERKLVIMGCYGIGTTRLVGTIVEASHDEKGIIWPKSVAPYLVHLLSLGESEEVTIEAEKIYKALQAQKIEVLFDDRDESAGKKFNDADLIGLPLRIVVSGRTVKEGNAEWKLRKEKDATLMKLERVVEEVVKFSQASS